MLMGERLNRPSGSGWVRFDSQRGGVLKSALFFGFFIAASSILAWMIALPAVFEWRLERTTGCDWSAERLACNPFVFEARIEEAVLGNSDEFGAAHPLMRIRSFRATANLESLIGDRILVEDVELDVSRLVLILNESGALNIERFVSDLFGEKKGFGDGLVLLNCRLKVDRVEIFDYSVSKPTRQTLRLGVNVDGFSGKGAMALFEPILEIARSGEYLPEAKSEIEASSISASRY